ncbi:MAG: decarboxylase [Desulfurococcaceae archaeon]
MSRDWNIEIARKIYGIENYVRDTVIDIDSEGYLVIRLGGEVIRIKELIERYKTDIAYIRVLPMIEKAMDLVYSAFKLVSESLDFHGRFTPVYPMKVNPTPVVVEAIMEYGDKYSWGFNTGSIGEVKLLENYASKYNPRTLIYDGVITENTIQELLRLRSIGWRVIVDIESEHDLEILSKYPELELGIRVKPLVKLHGKWSGSVGLGSKFGVTINNLHKLKSEYDFIMKRSTILHMHPGSQLYRIEDLRNYFTEVRQVYKELLKTGFENLQGIDPGGGMAYPYVDTRDGDEESPNYTIVDYFKELISIFRSIDPQPDLFFEGGRFIVSSHRIVVSKVVDIRSYSAIHSIQEHVLQVRDFNSIEDIRTFLSLIEGLLNRLRSEIPLNNGKREVYEDLLALLREDVPIKLSELILSGKIGIEDVLKDDKVIRLLITPTKRFVLNMSIFADIPDVVLVDQYFSPIPIQRLNEKPHVLASISDLTCDSMGEIKEFISPGVNYDFQHPIFTVLDGKLIAIPGIKLKLKGVPLHLLNRGENYYIAFLDTGAYQDTLTMKHNLIYGAPEIIIRVKNGEIFIEYVKHEEQYT